MRRLFTLLLSVGLVGALTTTAIAQDSPRTTTPNTPTTAAPIDIGTILTPEIRNKITQDQEDRIIFLLSGHEFFPSAQDLKAVTPLASLALLKIARDTSAKPSLRTRAIDALGSFQKSPELRSIFTSQLADNSVEDLYKRHYMTASMKTFKEDAVPWIRPFLASTDIQKRLSAVHLLKRFGGDLGVTLVRQHRATETDPVVLDNIKRLLDIKRPEVVRPNLHKHFHKH